MEKGKGMVMVERALILELDKPMTAAQMVRIFTKIVAHAREQEPRYIKKTAVIEIPSMRDEEKETEINDVHFAMGWNAAVEELKWLNGWQ